MDIHILFIYIYISPWISFCALNTRLPMLSTGAGAVLYTIHSKILGCPRQRGIDRSWKHWSWNIRVTRISTVVSWWSRTSFSFFVATWNPQELHDLSFVFKAPEVGYVDFTFFQFQQPQRGFTDSKWPWRIRKSWSGPLWFHFAFDSRDTCDVSCAYVARKSGDQFGPLHRFRQSHWTWGSLLERLHIVSCGKKNTKYKRSPIQYVYNKWCVKTISNGSLTTFILFPIRRGRCLRRNGQCISSFCNDTFRGFGFLALKSSWNSPALLLYVRERGNSTWKIYWTCLNHKYIAFDCFHLFLTLATVETAAEHARALAQFRHV